MKKMLTAALLALGLASCANWRESYMKSLDYAHKAGLAVRESSADLIDERCLSSARTCIKAGITTPEECGPWIQCNAVRDNISKGLVALQALILDGRMAVSIGDEATAADKVKKAIELAEMIRQQLVSLGVF